MSPDMTRLRAALDAAPTTGAVAEVIKEAYPELLTYIDGCVFREKVGHHGGGGGGGDDGPPPPRARARARARGHPNTAPSPQRARQAAGPDPAPPTVPDPKTQTTKAFKERSIPKLHEDKFVDYSTRALLASEALRAGQQASNELFSAIELLGPDYGSSTEIAQLAVAKFFKAARTQHEKVMELFEDHEVPSAFERLGFVRQQEQQEQQAEEEEEMQE